MNDGVSYDLTGRTAWITGSSRGIGKAIAEQFAACGARVIIHGTRSDSPRVFNEGESLEQCAADLQGRYGVVCGAVCGNLSDESTVEELTEEIERDFGDLDILVNCAGGDIGSGGVTAPQAGKPLRNDAVEISLEDIRAVLDRNLMTTILCSRAVARGMMRRRRGRIIGIGSIAGLGGIAQSALYATAKAAVHEYCRCLAVQLRPYDIPVNVIAPGETVTERFRASRPIDEERRLYDGTLERYGWPVEVARTAVFLASDAASFISGQVIRVDGGSQSWPS